MNKPIGCPPTKEEDKLCDEVVTILKEDPNFWSEHQCMYKSSHADGRHHILKNLRDPNWKGMPNTKIVGLIIIKQMKSERKQAESEREQAELEEELDMRSLGWIRKNRFMLVDRTATTPYFSPMHDKAAMKYVQFALNNVNPPPALWKAPFIPPQDVEKSVHLEGMVVSEAAKIIEAVLVRLGLGKCVTIATHRIIAGIECDIVLLVGSQLIPFAAIEVKKPGPSNFDDNCIFSPDSQDTRVGRVAGQNFDQLNALALMGFSSLCGMITNGNKFMITSTAKFSLGEQEDWNLNGKMHSPWNILSQVVLEQKLMGFIERETPPVGAPTAVKHHLFVSQVVSLPNGEDVVKLIAIFIHYACNSVAQLVLGKPELKELSCQVLRLKERHGPSMHCSFQKMQIPWIELSLCVDFDMTKEIFLICHLGCGMNGDCCLAVMPRGEQCCAIKFFVRQDDCSSHLKLAKDELESWQKVYGRDDSLPKCCLGYLPGDDAYLCMPYLMPIPKAECLARFADGSVEDALKCFADS